MEGFADVFIDKGRKKGIKEGIRIGDVKKNN